MNVKKNSTKHLTNQHQRNKIAKGKIHHKRTGVFARKTFDEEDYYDSI